MWFQTQGEGAETQAAAPQLGLEATKSLGSGRGEEVLTQVPGGLGVVVAGSGKEGGFPKS